MFWPRSPPPPTMKCPLPNQMWFQFTSPFKPRQKTAAESLQIGVQTVPLLLVRNARARRYLLRLRPDGTARVTIPRSGSQTEALAFVERNRDWLAEQLQRHQARPHLPAAWNVGTEIWFCGELVGIESAAPQKISFGAEILAVKDSSADLRPAIEKYLRQLAARELPPRVHEFAAQHQFTVQRITVRNQKSRWGSCSRRGTISLNWRLIQTPDFVRDYIILHELAHLRHMNHSERFWAEVERLCPDYRTAERWLKTHRDFLR
jgi:predicted metal-dependent hydrolase